MRILFLLYLLSFSLSSYSQTAVLELQTSNVNSSLRGLSVYSDEIAWASGSQGTFLRTSDGGINWQGGKVADADTLDFRDVQAFSAEEALLLSAGQPARILRTTNGGDSWEVVYADPGGKTFFDAFAFWDEHNGLAMSDPVDGNFLLLSTRNGGKSWQPVPIDAIPAAAESEGGFAASGSNLAVAAGKLALFGTGGPVARVFRSTDGGSSWKAINTPLQPTTPSSGIYSIAIKDSLHAIAVGGDYTRPDEKTNHLLITQDGGLSWQKIDHSGLGGYRSGIAYVPGTAGTFVAVGTNGIDISYNGGYEWESLSSKGMHAIRMAPSGKTGWCTGSNGQLLKLNFNQQ